MKEVRNGRRLFDEKPAKKRMQPNRPEFRLRAGDYRFLVLPRQELDGAPGSSNIEIVDYH